MHQASAEFVCAMRTCWKSITVNSVDETSKQQVKETRQPLPVRPGMPACYDYEYERNGVSNLFMLFAPLEGWRKVTDRRTKADWARVVMVDGQGPYPEHPPSRSFERRDASPNSIRKHGSWLRTGSAARQCLDRRIPCQDMLEPNPDVRITGIGTGSGGLAFHYRGRPHQIEVPLSLG